MKTKEIDVWVNKENLNDNYYISSYKSIEHFKHGEPLKAKLIIELPEKKIEITESQVDYAFGTLLNPDVLNDAFEEHKAAVVLGRFKAALGFTND